MSQSDAIGKTERVRPIVIEPRSAVRDFPVGSVFFGTTSTNPATTLGFGTWSAVQSGIWISIGTVDIYIWRRVS